MVRIRILLKYHQSWLYFQPADNVLYRVADRFNYSSTSTDHDIGFRCAR